MGNVDEPSPPRAGIPWSSEEESRLFEAIRDGTPIETLVAEFGRSEKALNTRARKMLPYRHPDKHRDDAITALCQLLTDDPTYRPPLGIRDQIRQEQYHRPDPDLDLAAIAESLLQKMTELSMAPHREPDDHDLYDEESLDIRAHGSRSGPDFDPSKTLSGNPHAEAASFVDDRLYPAAALREALLAIAFELRTANLIAAPGDRPDLDRRFGQ